MPDFVCVSAQSNSLGGAGASSITLASNYSSIIDTVEQIRANAQIKYNAGAFLHWYSKYGCEKVSMKITFYNKKKNASNDLLFI